MKKYFCVSVALCSLLAIAGNVMANPSAGSIASPLFTYTPAQSNGSWHSMATFTNSASTETDDIYIPVDKYRASYSVTPS